MNRRFYSQANNPENYWPTDEDTQTEAFNLYGQNWDALGSEEQDEIVGGLIEDHYKQRRQND